MNGKRRCWVLVGIVLAGGAISWLAGLWRDDAMTSALLKADPDRIPADTMLATFAATLAKPAFARHCAVCHGADMRGNQSLGAANLTNDDWLYGSGKVSEIERTLYFGIRSGNKKARNLADMPAFAHPQPNARYKVTPLTPEDIRAVITYLFSLEGRPADARSAERGRDVYLNKGGCYDCHSPHGHGDPGIGASNLTDNVWLYCDGSADSLFRTVEVGRNGCRPALVDRFAAATIRALAVYIHMRSHPAGAAGAGVAQMGAGK